MEPEPRTITKKELVNRIAEETRQTKVVVKDILQRFLDSITEELAEGNRIEFRDFGVFEVRDTPTRITSAWFKCMLDCPSSWDRAKFMASMRWKYSASSTCCRPGRPLISTLKNEARA